MKIPSSSARGHRPEAIEQLLSHLAGQMHRPFFVWSAPGAKRDTLLTRRHPQDDELAALADKITDSICGSLKSGYGFAALKAELPADFDNPARRAAVRAVIYSHIRDGR